MGLGGFGWFHVLVTTICKNIFGNVTYSMDCLAVANVLTKLNNCYPEFLLLPVYYLIVWKHNHRFTEYFI